MNKKIVGLVLFAALTVTSCWGNKNSTSSIISSSDSSNSSSSSLSESSSSSETSSSSEKNEFEIAKENAYIELDDYYASFNQDKYTEENWTTLTNAYDVGVIFIETATIIPEILSAVASAKAGMDNVERLAIIVNVVDINVYDAEHIRVYVDVSEKDLAIIPVSEIVCSLGNVEYQEILVVEGKTVLVLRGQGLVLNNGEFTISMVIKSIDLNISNVSYTFYNGVIKTLEYMKTLALNNLNDYFTVRGYTQEKYEVADWTIIQEYFTNGNQAINDATSYEEIDVALIDVKINIDSIPQIGITLDIFKTNAITELSDYTTAKDQSKYAPESWLIVQKAVNNGKQAINAGTDYKEVVIALNTAKTNIDGVNRIYNKTIIPTNVFSYSTQFFEIQFYSMTYKTTYEYSAKIDGNTAGVYNKFAFGPTGTAVQLQMSGMNLQTSSYTVELRILDGTTAYVATIKVVNGYWFR